MLWYIPILLRRTLSDRRHVLLNLKVLVNSWRLAGLLDPF